MTIILKENDCTMRIRLVTPTMASSILAALPRSVTVTIIPEKR